VRRASRALAESQVQGQALAAKPDNDDAMSLRSSMTTLSTISAGEADRQRSEVDVDLSLLQRLRQTTRSRADGAAPGVAPHTQARTRSAAAQPVTGRDEILEAIRVYRMDTAPVVADDDLFAPELDPDTGFFRVVAGEDERTSAPEHWHHLGRLVKPEYKMPPTYSEHLKHHYNNYRIQSGLPPIVNYDLGAFSDDIETRVLPDGRRYLDVAVLL